MDEGIRTIRILAHPGQRHRTREEELLDFLRRHWEFFATDPELRHPCSAAGRRAVAAHRRAHRALAADKASQPYAAGIEMQGRLAAGIDPPKWPR